jgi:hypothetical protein
MLGKGGPAGREARSGGRLRFPGNRGCGVEPQIGSRSWALNLWARLPTAKRTDQGGVVWGNPSDAFLIQGDILKLKRFA